MPRSILLASSSPRRVGLLQQIGLMFETMSPDVDESLAAGEMPMAYVERLSKSKAAAGLTHRTELCRNSGRYGRHSR